MAKKRNSTQKLLSFQRNSYSYTNRTHITVNGCHLNKCKLMVFTITRLHGSTRTRHHVNVNPAKDQATGWIKESVHTTRKVTWTTRRANQPRVSLFSWYRVVTYSVKNWKKN